MAKDEYDDSARSASPGEVTDTDDFDVVADNPDDYYESPSAVLSDADLTCEEKERLLEEWARDLEQIAVADNEGMAPVDDDKRERASEQLRQATTALRVLKGEEPGEVPSARTSVIGRIWRRLRR